MAAVAGCSRSSSHVSVQAAVRSRRAASAGGPIRCNADGLGCDKSCADSAKKSGPLRLSAVMVPMLAAAVVGGMQPTVQASEWVLPVDYTETSSTDGPYKDLLEKMKERRAAREKKSPTVQAEEKNSDVEAKPYSSPFFAPAPVYTPSTPPVQAPPPVVKAPEPAVANSSLEEVVAPVDLNRVVATEKQKTHGFLPLFVAQFLLIVATAGGGFVLITTPDSKWKELQKTVDGYVSKVTPVVENSWTKVSPLATQAQQKASQFVQASKPYVVKAWEVSLPLAAKAVEASKPILKGAKTKAVEFFEQATANKQ